MNFKTLLRKTKDAVKLHLTQSTFMWDVANVKDDIVLREHVVREDEVTRPDLIALEYYGGEEFVEYLLKWNGISDPFSLQPGDILEIPPKGLSTATLPRPVGVVEEDNPIKNQFMQTKNDRLPKKDQRRLDALKKRYNKDVLLPPNVIALGKKNYKFDKEGNIILGAQAQNADVNPANVQDPVVEAILADLGSPTGLGGGTGITSGSGSGFGGGSGLTENQLDKLLNNGQGPKSSGTGSGKGGNTATNYGGGKPDGTSPQGSNNADGVSNDGAPCK